MDVITKDVRALAKKELAAANRRFRMFASPHEGYAVIREELDELIDEVRKLHFGLTIRLWRGVKRNEPMKRESPLFLIHPGGVVGMGCFVERCSPCKVSA